MDSFVQAGLNAIKKVDDAARQGPRKIPDHIMEAIAHSVSLTMARLPVYDEHLFKGNLILQQNLYRAGYVAGKTDTEALLKVNQG